MTGFYCPIRCGADRIGVAIEAILQLAEENPIDSVEWEQGRYRPTPTIIEAAMALLQKHSVHEISRSDASATRPQPPIPSRR